MPPAPVAKSWAAKAAAWVQRHKRYPEAARARHEEGKVCVRVTVARDGQVAAVALTCSSRSEALDTAARNLFTNARLPAFPRSMGQAQAVVDLVLDYSIAGTSSGADQNMP